MPSYGATGQENTVTTGLTTALALTRGASKRIKVHEFNLSAGGTPADNVVRCVIMRHTAAPTLTALTPEPLDLADGAAVTTAGENASAEGTVTAGSEMFDQSFNQRAAYRWTAANDDDRLVVPNTAASGLSFRVSSPAYAGTFDYTGHFKE